MLPRRENPAAAFSHTPERRGPGAGRTYSQISISMSVELLPPPAPAAFTPSTAALQPEVPGHGLRVLEARVYRGPSIYAYRRVIRLTLDLGRLEAFPSDELAGFNDALL